MADETPFQTIGPFFHFALIQPDGNRLVDPATRGHRITIAGAVLDGAGEPVTDALVEIWQANADGRYHHPDDDEATATDPAFDGFGRAPTSSDGQFVFETIMPGPVAGPDGVMQAPHVLVSVLARGLLTRLVTRVYFEGDPALASDPILSRVPENRRATLIGRREADDRFRFDIRMQGVNETVFFDI